ncbi:hypothetical protein SAY87_017380 [Trapa incisa]|uniref:Histone acetyltransferase n=1 Tax=Trapa incisa TaxID=236973 RepID=A0AAN7LBV2_9MYRT|nr:hypothetical protein SAY87_017380 [Trapa incisa]
MEKSKEEKKKVMTRPGPRPYECVRRAWHSERHQSLRGSIIQQIFRLVTKAHSSATKNNREWGEKLPVVVLRAEEIMYSKANSQAEYMNIETLWERLNDAIDTIIRRDQSSETGDLLPPCVEAALYLGCAPMRASRRQSNSRVYLTPKGQDSPPHTHSPNKSIHDCMSLPVQTSNQPNYPRPPEAAACGFPVLYQIARCKFNPLKNLEIESAPNRSSIYPLYYVNHHYLGEKFFARPSVDNTILVGTPVMTPICEPPRISPSQRLLPHERASSSIKDNAEAGENIDRKKRCDLSLRLGMGSKSKESSEGGLEDPGSSSSQEFCFFQRESHYSHQTLFK